MSYADIVSTIALIGTIFSIGWQIYTWLHQEKREEATTLKVYVCSRERHDTAGKSHNHWSFVISNIGSVGITILSCHINGKSISESRELCDPNIFIGAKLAPKNSVQCEWFGGAGEIVCGHPVEVTYKTDFGKEFCKVFTLSEANE